MLWAVLGFALLLYPPLSWRVELPSVFWLRQCLSLLMLAGIFYLNYFWVTPAFLFRNKVGMFFVLLLCCMLSVLVGNYLVSACLSFDEIMAKVHDRPVPKQPNFIDSFVLTLGLLVLGISTAVAAVQRWQKASRTSEELQKQQIAAELDFLKAQINPHFFFNTLNNIYSLSYTDIELSREALHTLSRMMRYLLYETQHNKVSLQKEIDFLKDHIALMSLRLHQHTTVDFENPPLTKDFMVAPMLFLPFVENALKHGVSTTEPTHIYIGLKVEGNSLCFRVENTIIRTQKIGPETGGIGLQNTKRRLELQYPEKYTLALGEVGGNRYLVELKLDLT